MDVDLEILRRNDTHVIVARQFGVVVKSKDLDAGLREAEARIAAVAAELREVGVVPLSAPKPSLLEPQTWSSLVPVLAPSVAIAAVFSAFLLLASIPLINAVATLRSTVNQLVPLASANSVDEAGRSGVNLLVRFADAVDHVTPERKEEMRAAVRRIVEGLRPVLDEVRPAANCPSCPAQERRR